MLLFALTMVPFSAGCQAEEPKPLPPPDRQVKNSAPVQEQPPQHQSPRTPEVPKTIPSTTVERLAAIMYQSRCVTELRDAAVQRQLDLTPQQVAQLQSIGKSLDNTAAIIRKRDRNQLGETINEFEPLAESIESQLDSILTGEQSTKALGMIAAKQRGAIALLFPGVETELQLTDEQRRRLVQLADGDLELILHASAFQIPKLIRQTAASRENAESLLTPEQRRKWNELVQP